MDTLKQAAPSNPLEAVPAPVPARKSRRHRSKLMQFELLSALFSARRAAPAEQSATNKAEDLDSTLAYALRNLRR